jgi:hypothetical protein
MVLWRLSLMSAVLVAAVAVHVAAAQELPFAGFPFSVPYEGLVEGTAPAELGRLDRPAGAQGFMQARGDRLVFSGSGQPVRFWATNLSIRGCFPPHDVADRMARRLAALGVNCVRMHFMDRSGWPDGIWDSPGWGDMEHKGLHSEALDRLDYLVARLKEHGVYTNINLHVARSWSPQDGFPSPGQGESVPGLGKGVSLFYPRCIEEQKRYARMLLRHVNAYTGSPYAEEPAVAFVEIANENGLLSTWFGSGGSLDDLPGPYMDELRRQWNGWLAGRYRSTEALREAWAGGQTPASGRNLAGMAPYMQVAGAAQATLEASDGGRTHTVRVQAPGSEGWHTQLLWRPLGVEAGRSYCLTLRMRANRREQVNVSCGHDHEPWRPVGLYETVFVGPARQDYRFRFIATESDAPDADGRGGVRVSVSGLAKEGLEVAVADVSLELAEVHGLAPAEGLGDVAWVRHRDWSTRSEAFRLDQLRFLCDTEASFWTEMHRYLKAELGVRMAVTGTAAGNTTPWIAAATVDFVDSHAYWQHPHFPGRPWDPADWTVSRRAMVSDPVSSTIGPLAGLRVFGLPFTVSEYNHPAPNDYRGEGFPLVAVYGSLQGWDAVFTYTYSHGDFEQDHFDNFFDVKADPLKLAVQPACSDMLRHGRIAPDAAPLAVDLPPEGRLRFMLAGRPWQFAPHAFAGNADPLAWQRRAVGIGLDGQEPPAALGPGSEVQWVVGTDGRGAVTYVGETCCGIIGFAAAANLKAGPFRISAVRTSLDDFAVIMVNAVDGQRLGRPGRYLITAVARAENEGMGWNTDRSSVGAQWGRGPTLCEGVAAELHCEGVCSLYPLAADGTRQRGSAGQSDAGMMPVRTDAGQGSLYALGPRYRTLWYELVLRPPVQ